MMSCHLIPMWHEWNTNANDVIITWLTLYVDLVTSCLACVTHVHMHGTHALCKTSMSKYSSGLVCMQANPNFAKINNPHFWVLSTQNANYNMPNMVPIAYLNENSTDCNENLAWGKQEPLIHPYMFWNKTKGEKVVKTSFYILFM